MASNIDHSRATVSCGFKVQVQGLIRAHRTQGTAIASSSKGSAKVAGLCEPHSSYEWKCPMYFRPQFQWGFLGSLTEVIIILSDGSVEVVREGHCDLTPGFWILLYILVWEAFLIWYHIKALKTIMNHTPNIAIIHTHTHTHTYTHKYEDTLIYSDICWMQWH